MPSSRRTRVLGFALMSAVIVILYYSAHPRRARSPDFYASTAQKLAEQDAGAKLSETGPRPRRHQPDVVVQRRPEPAADDRWPLPGKTTTGRPISEVTPPPTETETEPAESQAARELEMELGRILKRSPIIIFSKSYCPFSSKAKKILLDRYEIVPAPFVVELDMHPLGAALQQELAHWTGRRTVPNVLISGKSIGGGDDVAALDTKDELIHQVRRMGGKRIMEAKLRSST